MRRNSRLITAVVVVVALGGGACTAERLVVVPPGTVLRTSQETEIPNPARFDRTNADGQKEWIVVPGKIEIPAGYYLVPPPADAPAVRPATTPSR